MINKKIIFAALMALAFGNAMAAVKSLDSKAGTQWQLLPQADIEGVSGNTVSTPGYNLPASAITAVVPGVVFTSYVEAGLEQDPDYADNIYRVDESLYSRPFWYRAEFATPSMKKGEHLWINFDNINRYADFFVNGHKISGTDESTRDVSGHMIRSRYDITPYLRNDGKNAVAVLITDADQKKSRKADGPYGVACSPSYLAGAGWDWMPYIPGRLNGLTGHVSLEVTGDAVMTDPWVRSVLPTNDCANLEITTGITNLTNTDRRVTVEATIMPGKIKVSDRVVLPADSKVNLTMDTRRFEQLVVKNPVLWWPNGYGDPNLYTCTLTVRGDNNEVLHQKDITFGIRKFDYKLETNKVGFPVLNFYVNGKRIYLKGGNWGMSEYLLRCHDEEYETKVRLHKDLNYNVIRLWTGCVTDDEFYDYCDRYGIMVWNDFWLYVAWNDVAEPDAFKANALDKVRRLRNHASIALWCGANETHPAKDLDDYLRKIVAEEDHNDRMYKSCSNQDALSGSGWWGNQPPRHHFSTSGSNLAFNTPSYPYGIDYGYGMRSEIGMATFPVYESVIKFIPEKDQWPLPDDDALRNDDENVWNRHFFGKEASNASPINYKNAVNSRYGESSSLEEFCEKAQLINIEDMKGMYEAWNDKMWNDAAGLIIWMSHPAYPSFVWQTYDYYYDPSGAYWGAKKGCEHTHIQWNPVNNSIKAINTTGKAINNAVATARVYGLDGKVVAACSATGKVNLPETGNAEAFKLKLDKAPAGVHFIVLELRDAEGRLLSDNFYWHNGTDDLNYQALDKLPANTPEVKVVEKAHGKVVITLSNNKQTVAFANRIRLLDSNSGDRVLPVIMNDNYITLLPGEEKQISIEFDADAHRSVDVMVKQFGHKEQKMQTVAL